jgi:glycine cleavage system H protein
MDIPSELKYTEEHEWVDAQDDIAVIGITDWAQGELGDIVYLELPDIGTTVKQMDVFGTIEAVKTVAELFSPVSGEVIEVNVKLEDEPELINSDPYSDGWMVKIRMDDPTELENLLSADDYQSLIS